MLGALTLYCLRIGLELSGQKRLLLSTITTAGNEEIMNIKKTPPPPPSPPPIRLISDDKGHYGNYYPDTKTTQIFKKKGILEMIFKLKK